MAYTHKSQLAQQAKIDSARLSIEMVSMLHSNHYREFMDLLYSQDGVNLDWTSTKEEMERFLNHVDKICGFYEEELITKRHMEENHINLIKKLKGDKVVVKYMNDHPHLYLPIKRMFNKI